MSLLLHHHPARVSSSSFVYRYHHCLGTNHVAKVSGLSMSVEELAIKSSNHCILLVMERKKEKKK